MSPGCAPAKVNLWLHVGKRRKDGYHEVGSLIAFALDATDELTAEPADALTLKVAGPESAGLSGEADNLILKAARALAREAGKRDPGAALTLHKSLPVASGIGGGSADAAAAMRLLNEMWELDWPLPRLAKIAEEIGADAPVCVWSRPAAVEGKGERVELLGAWPELHAVLINPRQPVSTKDVFDRHDSAGGKSANRVRLPLGVAHAAEAITLVRQGGNDLEPAAMAIAPVIADVLAALRAEPDCALARMSGSGASCFGLYDGPQAAARAAARISKAEPGWWVMATRLGGCGEE